MIPIALLAGVIGNVYACAAVIAMLAVTAAAVATDRPGMVVALAVDAGSVAAQAAAVVVVVVLLVALRPATRPAQ